MYAGIGAQIGQNLVEVAGVEQQCSTLGFKVEPKTIGWGQTRLAEIVD